MPPPPPPLQRLPGREREIAELVMSLGEATAGDVHGRLRGCISNSAIRSMLTRLEAKRVLRKRREGNRYVYSVAIDDPQAREALLLQIAEQHFGGSVAALAAELGRLLDRPARQRGGIVDHRAA
jgi:predicted transcriptional regulator